MPSTPTPSPISGANAYRIQEFPSDSSRRVKIPISILAYPSPLRYSTASSESVSFANQTTPKLKSRSRFSHTPVVPLPSGMPISSEPDSELLYPHPDLSISTTLQPLLLSSLSQTDTPTSQLVYPSFSSLVPLPIPVSVPIPRPGHTNTDPDITLDLPDIFLPHALAQDIDHDRFSFIQSDDWHLSGGVEDIEYGFGVGRDYPLGHGHGYVSPISRRDSARMSYDADAHKISSGGRERRTDYSAFLKESSSDGKNRQENSFLQKLISVSGRASGSRSATFSSPVARERLEGNQESTGRSSTARLMFPDVSVFEHRSSSLPSRSHSGSRAEPLQEIMPSPLSSPLTSLSASPSSSPVPTQSNTTAKNDLYTPVPTQTQSPAAPRFTRKPHYVYLTPSQAHPSTTDLVLTPSCTDQAQASAPAHIRDGDIREEGVNLDVNVNPKHRYRTRSKLAGVRGWVRVNGSVLGSVKGRGVGREESASFMQGLKKRKREVEDDLEKLDLKTTMVKKKNKKHMRDQDESENDDESIYAPSPIASRRSMRLSKSPSKDKFNLPSRLNINSKSQSNTEPSSLTLQFTSSIPNLRTFPPNTPYHPMFSLFYRRFPAPSQMMEAVSLLSCVNFTPLSYTLLTTL